MRYMKAQATKSLPKALCLVLDQRNPSLPVSEAPEDSSPISASEHLMVHFPLLIRPNRDSTPPQYPLEAAGPHEQTLIAPLCDD